MGSVWACPLAVWRSWSHGNTPCYPAEFCHVKQCELNEWDHSEISDTSRPAIQGQRNWQRLISFLWRPINVSWQPLAYLVLFVRQMATGVTNCKFCPSRVCLTPLGIGGGLKKLEWWGYQADKKFDDVSCHLDTIWEFDRWRDGRTVAHTKYRAHA